MIQNRAPPRLADDFWLKESEIYNTFVTCVVEHCIGGCKLYSSVCWGACITQDLSWTLCSKSTRHYKLYLVAIHKLTKTKVGALCGLMWCNIHCITNLSGSTINCMPRIYLHKWASWSSPQCSGMWWFPHCHHRNWRSPGIQHCKVLCTWSWWRMGHLQVQGTHLKWPWIHGEKQKLVWWSHCE